MKLQSIRIENFKGMGNRELVFDGKSAKIIGGNGQGKSRTVDAFNWLLTGKDQFGSAKFDIKPYNAEGEVAREDGGLECTVEAVFSREDGTKFKLTRVHAENWVTPTGKAEAVYRGDQTNCFIDDVPKAVGEFNKYIEGEFAEESIIRLLSNTAYFNEQTTNDQERRDLLFSVFGDLTDEEVIATSDTLKPLADRLENRSVEDFSLMMSATLKRTNEELDKLPIRIDEASKSIVEGIDKADSEKKIADHSSDIDTITAEIKEITEKAEQEQPDTSEIESKLRVAKRRLSTLEVEYNSKEQEYLSIQNRARAEKLNKAEDELSTAKLALSQHTSKMGNLSVENEKLMRERDNLLAEHKQVNESQAQIDKTCPTCNQDFPSDYLDEVIGNWNEQKSKKLKQLNDTGKETRSKIDKNIEVLKELAKEKETLEKQVKSCESAVKKISDTKVVYTPDKEEEKEFETAKTLALSEIKELEEALRKATPEPIVVDVSQQKAEIAKLEQAIGEERDKIAQAALNEQSESRIKEYRKKQTELGAVRDDCSKMIFLCKEFSRIKANAISENINQHFQIVRFNLFEELKNGNIREVCETTVDGKSYTGNAMNRALKVAASLDVIHTFGKKLGKSFPVFVDDNEGIYETYGVETGDLQIVKLEAVDGDKPLEVVFS